MVVVLGILLILFVVALGIEIYMMVMISVYEHKGLARMIKGLDLKTNMSKEEIFFILDSLEYPEKVSVQYDAEENIIFQTSMRTYKIDIGKSIEGNTVIEFADTHPKLVGAARKNSRIAHLYQLVEDKCMGVDTTQTLKRFSMIESFYTYKKIVGAAVAILIVLLAVILLKQDQDKSEEQVQETVEVQLEEGYVEENTLEEIGNEDISTTESIEGDVSNPEELLEESETYESNEVGIEETEEGLMDESVLLNDAAVFIGEWLDANSQRCYMEISSEDGINFNIDINWASSAWENTHWSFYGTFDEMANGIHYYGSRIEEYYPDDGEMQETYVYSDGEGLIWMGDDSMLHWDDYTEQEGADCFFEKSEY